jgi:hypothetical protein
LVKHEIVAEWASDTNDTINIGSCAMQHENNQAGLDFADVWRAAQYRRAEDVSDIDILKTVTAFCGVGLLVSLFLAIIGLDITTGIF